MLWKRGNKMIKRYKENEIEKLVKILKNDIILDKEQLCLYR